MHTWGQRLIREERNTHLVQCVKCATTVGASSAASITPWVALVSVPLGGLVVQRLGLVKAAMVLLPAIGALELGSLLYAGGPLVVAPRDIVYRRVAGTAPPMP